MGNTTLFTRAPEYSTWKRQDNSSTLLYFGMLGCGKSVTMANMVDDLNLSAGSQSSSVVYFFVQYGYATSLEARTIIGSIARQILHCANNFSDTPESLQESLSIESMTALIIRLISPKHAVYIVMDGLDLCTRSAKEEVVEFLRELQTGCCVRVCISSRLEPSIEYDPILQGLQLVQILRSPDNHQDMDDFISAELSRCLKSRALVLGDPTLVLNIQDTLLAGAKGMFLWVALQINSICSLQTDDEIRTVLAHLPHDLSETYARVVQSQHRQASKYQRRIFKFIAAAQKPLTTREFQDALSVTPGDTTWSASKLINDVNSALASCGCLVVVDEEELTVRFVHPTVQQYIFERYTDALGNGMTATNSHAAMADAIVTYLSYGVFGTDVSTSRVPQINVSDVPAQILSSALSRGGVQSIALNLLNLRRRHDVDIGKVVAHEVSARHNLEITEYWFRTYAEQYCAYHVRHAARPYSTHVKSLYPAVFGKLCLADTSKHVTDSSCVSRATLGLELATQHLRLAWSTGSPNEPDLELVSLILPTLCGHRQLRDVVEDELGRAICEGDRVLDSVLCDRKDFRINWPAYLTGKSSKRICLLAYKGDADCLDFARGLDVYNTAIHHVCKSGRTLLECAIWGDNLLMARGLLFYDGAKFDSGSTGTSLIWQVVEKGWLSVVRLMFCTNEVMLRDGEGVALQLRSRELGHDKINKLLDEVTAYNLTNRAFSSDIKDWRLEEQRHVPFYVSWYHPWDR
ncbi:hypothetical protein BKA63DRAFT_247566 [Paraphoma chrysanthemicola]|nr:hypothetical protein BKA63DRAFT_247566 [Paraphoma chrysanthemicola]